jgi:hypothetical protein
MTLAPCFDQVFFSKHSSVVSLNEQHQKLILATLTLVNPDCNIDHFFQSSFDVFNRFANLLTVYMNEIDRALFFAEFFNREPVLGLKIKKAVFHDPRSPEWKEMDIIDSRHLDMNIQLMRHSYFNLNRMLVDDLFDIIVRQLNARERSSRLMRVNHNLFTFLAAPRHITN